MIKSFMITFAVAAFYANASFAQEISMVDDTDLMQWNEVAEGDLKDIRGGFFADVGGIGVDLDWVIRVDVNNAMIFSHDVTDDFIGKVVNIDSAGNFAVSDFQSLAFVLQNSSDNIQIGARQLLDVQLSNIEIYKESLFTSQFNHTLTQSILQ